MHYLTGASGRLGVNSDLFPSPFVAVAAEVEENRFGRAVAILTYEVAVAGKTGTVPIDVVIRGEAAGGVLSPPLGNGAMALQATWEIANAPGTDAVNLTANQRYRVTLRADVGVATGVTNGAASGAYAYVDPVFSLAAGVSEDDYAFFFSEGVGNTPLSEPPTVPEPGASLLLVGVLLSLARRSHSRLSRSRSSRAH